MDKDEALRMALKSLEFYYDLWKEKVDAQTIAAIRKVLAEPEPVQVTINDFVAAVKGKEDWVGRPIFWVQWPNKEKNKC